jgi:hypothetical protein
MVSSGAFARRSRIDDDWASNAFVEQPRCQPRSAAPQRFNTPRFAAC